MRAYLLLIAICVATASASSRLDDALDKLELRDRLVTYTRAVDVVLSGNTTDDALDVLMDHFSDDWEVIWNTGPAMVATEYIGKPAIRLNYKMLGSGNVSYPGSYSGYSRHLIHNALEEKVKCNPSSRNNKKDCWLQTALLTENLSANIFQPNAGMQIHGAYSLIWGRERSGEFAMRSFHTDTYKLFFDPQLPVGKNIFPPFPPAPTDAEERKRGVDGKRFD
jgi:hypothetical protein